jgi:hypothetical protein
VEVVGASWSSYMTYVGWVMWKPWGTNRWSPCAQVVVMRHDPWLQGQFGQQIDINGFGGLHSGNWKPRMGLRNCCRNATCLEKPHDVTSCKFCR